MEHYFISKEHKKEDYFFYTDSIGGKTYKFKSVDSVFSKDKIDDGTRVLIDTVLENYESLDGEVLDFGCGVGVIGIVLKNQYPNINLTMCDINKTCAELALENIKTNDIHAKVIESNLYDNIKGEFGYIITNPPIKVGKEILFGVVSGGYTHMEKGGHIVLVIRKSHGMESMKKHMTAVFGNCQILKRDKGFYILRSIK